MENNKMRFKMYKSGKNWMVAGLMTTAVLAGLTLSNVNNNDVVAHADTVATTQVASASSAKQTVSQEQYNSQSAVVNSAASAVSSQQAVVNNDSAALQSAASVNSGVANVNSAKVAYDSANAAYNSASAVVAQDKTEMNRLKNETAHATSGQPAKDADYAEQWNRTDSAVYSSAQANLDQSTKDLQDGKTAASAAQVASESAQKALVAAKAASNAASSAKAALPSDADQSAVDDADAAIVAANEQLHQAREAVKKAASDLTAAQQKQFFAQLAINKDNETIKNLEGHKDAADRYADNMKKLDAIRAKRAEDTKLMNALGQIASDKYYALKQVQLDNLLPDADQLASMASAAGVAQNQINDDKVNTTYTNVTKLENDVKGDEHYLGKMNDKLAKDQAALTNATNKLADAKKANDTDLITFWQGKVDTYTQSVKDDKAAVKKAEDGLNWQKQKLAKAQADPAYKAIVARITKNQAIVDQYNNSKKNLEAAADLQNSLKPLQEKLANDQKTLDALTEVYNHEKGILDNMVVEGATQADQYGDQLISGSTSTVAGTTPAAPSKDQVAKAVAQSQASVMAASLASAPAASDVTNNSEALAHIKSTAWADPEKVANDSKTPGTYTEQVIVTFNDGSTRTIDWTLTVTAANSGENTNPGNTNKPGEAVKPGNNNGATNNGASSSVVNGSVNGSVANASTISSSKVSVNSNKAANQNAKLAQTGNSDSAAVVALGALSAMLGLGMVAKKREF